MSATREAEKHEKKRRITPHPVPPRDGAAAAIELTPERYMEKVQSDAATIAETMNRWQSMGPTEMQYATPVDLHMVSVLATRMAKHLSSFQDGVRARRCEEQRAEDERATRKPVPIDRSETELYEKYRYKLTGGNTVLYKCWHAGVDGVCTAGPVPCGPGLRAIMDRHYRRVHLNSPTKRAAHHGLGEAMAEGWVVP
jgi:hypothetical protein